MQNVYVTPALDAEGKAKRVPDPVTGQALPAAGGWQPRSQYWLRRIIAGDVTEGKPPVETATVQTAPAVVEEAPAAKSAPSAASK